METKSKHHVTFHRSHCPFARADATIPADYTVAEFANKPYFFVSKDGNPTAVGNLRGYPMIYSLGYETEQAALDAAEEWEAMLPEVDRACERAQAACEEVFGSRMYETFL
jgi:hypothetical protein